MNNNCTICPDENIIALYLEGKLEGPTLVAFRRHLSSCRSCFETVRLAMELNSREDSGTASSFFKEKSNEKDLWKGAAAVGGIGFLLSQVSHLPMASENNLGASERNSFDGDSTQGNKNFINMENQIHHAPNQFGEDAKIDVSSDVFQGYQDTCAIRSQQLVLNDFGVPVTQEDLISEASQKGWYHQGDGTPMEDVGNLLESHGIAVNRMVDANVYNLINELAQGHEVIIGVDANELWNGGYLQEAKDAIFGETPNHALIVAGIDTTDPDNIQVVLKDPGTGDVAKAYPLEQFLDAWHDSSNYMVSTLQPAPLAYNPEMVNFNYADGHIPEIGNMPYEYFEHQILPLTDNLTFDLDYSDNLYHDFMGIVSGQMTDLSPELLHAIEHTPLGHDPFNPVQNDLTDYHYPDLPIDDSDNNPDDSYHHFDHLPGSELI